MKSNLCDVKNATSDIVNFRHDKMEQKILTEFSLHL